LDAGALPFGGSFGDVSKRLDENETKVITRSMTKTSRIFLWAVAAAFSIFLPAVAYAGKAEKGAKGGKVETPRLDEREERQEKRIAKGVQSGALTGQEAAQLQARETKLNADEAAAKADGKVTKQEKQVLLQESKETGAAIKSLKHNGEKTPTKAKKSK
jgi:hypothetical protein